jgi:hypothetical protein
MKQIREVSRLRKQVDVGTNSPVLVRCPPSALPCACLWLTMPAAESPESMLVPNRSSRVRDSESLHSIGPMFVSLVL